MQKEKLAKNFFSFQQESIFFSLGSSQSLGLSFGLRANGSCRPERPNKNNKSRPIVSKKHSTNKQNSPKRKLISIRNRPNSSKTAQNGASLANLATLRLPKANQCGALALFPLELLLLRIGSRRGPQSEPRSSCSWELYHLTKN